MSEARVPCRTPTAGRSGVTSIPLWKFDLIRAAILDELAETDIALGELAAAVELRLGPDDISRLGSLGWHVTTVKLELEVRGEILRRPGAGRQRLGLAFDLRSELTCPECDTASTHRMPVDFCQWFLDCPSCGTVLRPKPGDCCVFCSYGSVPCPPIQTGAGCCASE